MTCKDCIHYETCEAFGCLYFDECSYFIDKSEIIKLPCKIGDTVYFIEEEYTCDCTWCSRCECQKDYEQELENDTCRKVHFRKRIRERTMRTLNDIFRWYSCFGKTVFLTPEEAEAKNKGD